LYIPNLEYVDIHSFIATANPCWVYSLYTSSVLITLRPFSHRKLLSMGWQYDDIALDMT